MGLCRHCHYKPATKRRLCHRCWSQPFIRDMYPIVSKHAATAKQDFCGKIVPAESPTDAYPGTLAKIAVLAERAAAGQTLWHPRDACYSESQSCAIPAEDAESDCATRLRLDYLEE